MATTAKKLLIALIILEIGIFALTKIGKGFISNSPVPEVAKDFVDSIDGVGFLLMLGVGFLILIMIPVYLSKRSKPKTTAQVKV